MQQRRSKRIRYAVVGLGHLAQVAVLPAFKNAPNSELVAIVSGDAEKRKKLGRKYALEHVYSYEQYEKALSEVDAVYLVLPNHLHHEYTVRAAAAGIHVLCEKPMAVTEEECEAMIEAADTHTVKLMIAYRLHFEKANLEAIRLVKSGKLGNARIFDSVFSQQVVATNVRVSEPVEKGGGPVYDMGVYCINAARYLFQAEPTAVLASSANNGERRFQGVDEMTSAIMRFPDERLATFACSFGASDVSFHADRHRRLVDCRAGIRLLLDVKYAVNGWGILCLQQSYRDVAHRHSGRCLAIKSSMVGVAMYHKVSAMSVYHLSQSRAAEEGEDFPGFTVRRFGDRRIVQHYNSLRGPQL